MTIKSIKCDVCGKVKGEANKWLQLRRLNKGVWIGTHNINPGVEDICSDACLQKRLGEIITNLREEETIINKSTTKRA